LSHNTPCVIGESELVSYSFKLTAGYAQCSPALAGGTWTHGRWHAIREEACYAQWRPLRRGLPRMCTSPRNGSCWVTGAPLPVPALLLAQPQTRAWARPCSWSWFILTASSAEQGVTLHCQQSRSAPALQHRHQGQVYTWVGHRSTLASQGKKLYTVALDRTVDSTPCQRRKAHSQPRP
jgi:hypothetical protein